MKLNKLRALILAALLVSTAGSALAGTFVSITIAPPVLPVYTQPVCPGEGYIWTPGYWAYGPNGYYWVPGTWVLTPRSGYLWTPGYWGWSGGFYIWHGGYWGLHIGFYGGINYGFGYSGLGYYGGYWNGDRFYYNRSVTNINVTNIHNTYNKVVIPPTVNRSSFNGRGGIEAKPTREEMQAGRERHLGATSGQLAHEHKASTDRTLLASLNKGRPATAATNRPLGEHANGGAAGALHPNREDRKLSHANSPQANRSIASKTVAPRTFEGAKNKTAPRTNVTHPHSMARPVHQAAHTTGGNHAAAHRGRR
jgi:hypothetical protein